METKEYIESGILELFVYGLLNENENNEVSQMAKKHSEVNNEIISIEKSIVNISTSFSPFLSADNFEKIKAKLDLKYSKVIQLETKKSPLQFIGWAAAAVLLVATFYQYNQQKSIENQVVVLEKDKSTLKTVVVASENKTKKSQEALSVIRDQKNMIVALSGQTVSPTSYAKVYWNKETHGVYIDAAGLPAPPKGMVYQVWSLKLKPTLTPTSIGLLEDFSPDNNRLFAVSNTNDAEAFGITLEPTGGSPSPTMEQLYTLGKV